ncbi:IS6 family transposase [Sulfitobacter geojensis]|uniref:IS6 family transposase n=1 Tax=Sulfitobacter geojensis TaxID=1342299 RepID=UPI0036DDC8CE
MAGRFPFKHDRFPREIVLCPVRWYLRYPLSYQDVVDLLAERGVSVDRSTVYRWVQTFGPELAKGTEKHLCRASVGWQFDETYIRVGGPLFTAASSDCRAMSGAIYGFRPAVRRAAKAAKAFLNKAIEPMRLHRPVSIVTDKAKIYRRVTREINHRYDQHFDSTRYIDRKWRNNLIETDHAAMKRRLGYRQSIRSLRSAKATQSGIETIQTIKRGHIHHRQPGVLAEM